MEKEILEEKMEREAMNKLRREWADLYLFLHKNEIARKLMICKVRLTGSGGALDQFIGEYMPFDGESFKNILHEQTNLEKVLKDRLQELEQKELDDILNKLSNLAYLFNN
jgi:hypothetical protein